MRLAEETILLLLNEESGYLEHVGTWNLACAMAGSVLADLALEFRIDTDLESLTLIDATETGDDLLDPVLAQIAAHSPPVRNAQFWIEKTAHRSARVIDSVLQRLVRGRILDHDTGGFWSLSRPIARTGLLPSNGSGAKEETRRRILRTVLDESIPDPRDIVLISLVAACDAFRLLLAEDELEQARPRIQLICKMDLLGRAIGAAIEESRARPTPGYVSHSRPMPKARLPWLIAQPHLRRGDFSRLMTDAYREYGPVFRIAPPLSRKGLVVLAGPELNAWINRDGRYFFRSRDHMSDFENLYGASRTMPGMDGAEHFRIRRSLRSAYSPSLLEGRLDELYRYARAGFEDWPNGDVLPAAAACQKAMSLQVSRLLAGVDTSDCIADVLKYEHRSLVTHVQNALPRFMMHTPAMRRRRRIILDLIGRINAAHTPAQRRHQPRDLVDSVLDLHAADPQFLPETDLGFLFVATMIASIYLGSGLAFALYGMAANPDVHRRVRAEADALFADGDPDAGALAGASVARRVFLESQRMYPVIPVQLRTVMNHLVVHGYDVPKGTRVLFGHTATHHLETLFPDPERFDIERFSPPREEHKATGAYVPFGLGTHRCLGSKLVELQMAVNLLLAARRFDIGVAPSNYELGFNPFPTAAPNRKLGFRVHARRNFD